MPYKKKTYAKKRKTYGRGYHPYVTASAPAVGYIATQAAMKVVKKYLNTELKYIDIDNQTAAGNAITTVGVIIHLNPIAQGAASFQRTGNQCKMKSIDLNYIVTGNVDDTTDTAVKVFLCKVQKTDNALPTYPDYFDTTVSDASTLDNINRINALRQINETQNISILQTHRHLLSPDGKFKVFGAFHQSLNAISRWQEDSQPGSIDFLEQNAYFLMYISDATSNTPTIKFVSRARYVDN